MNESEAIRGGVRPRGRAHHVVEPEGGEAYIPLKRDGSTSRKVLDALAVRLGVVDPRARFAPPKPREGAEPLGGVSTVDRMALQMALILHVADLAIQEEKAAERLLKAVADEAGRPREGRMSQLSKREHLNVADLTGRRHGRTYGPSRNGWIPVKWLDTGERETVRESGLLLRFTVQSVGFVPVSERDSEVAEDAAVYNEEGVA